VDSVDIVMQSFGRCCSKERFFDDFYEIFFASSEKIRNKFVNTNMEAQKKLLRQGILNLLLYARGMPDDKLQQLAKSHSKRKMDIAPDLYDFWLDSLITACKMHDDLFTPADEKLWREVLKKGIDIIKAGYDK